MAGIEKEILDTSMRSKAWQDAMIALVRSPTTKTVAMHAAKIGTTQNALAIAFESACSNANSVLRPILEKSSMATKDIAPTVRRAQALTGKGIPHALADAITTLMAVTPGMVAAETGAFAGALIKGLITVGVGILIAGTLIYGTLVLSDFAGQYGADKPIDPVTHWPQDVRSVPSTNGKSIATLDGWNGREVTDILWSEPGYIVDDGVYIFYYNHDDVLGDFSSSRRERVYQKTFGDMCTIVSDYEVSKGRKPSTGYTVHPVDKTTVESSLSHYVVFCRIKK